MHHFQSTFGCCCSGIPVLPTVCFDFDAAVFWCQLLGFTYFVIPNGYIRF